MTSRPVPVAPAPSPIERIAYAQNAEDIVLMRVFHDVRNGLYVDVGAGDPVEGSVTKNLADALGWRGVDIEPQGPLCDELRKQRPHSRVFECAVGHKGHRPFYRLVDNWGMSTLDEGIAAAHSEAGWKVVKEEIEVSTLDELLEGIAKPGFELLKIDVEGAEAEVLETFDLNKWMPQVILIEATYPASTKPSHESWETMLESASYSLCLFDGLNRFYVSPRAGERAHALSIPANVFDRYIPLRWWKGLSDEARDAADPLHRLHAPI